MHRRVTARRRLTATVAMSGALLLTLTGCLGEEGTQDQGAGGAFKAAAAQFMAQVSDKTEQADTYSMRMVSTANMTVQSQKVETRTESRMQVRLRPEPAMKGTVTTTMSGLDGLGAQAAQRPTEMVMIGGTIYMKLNLPQGGGSKPWLKMSLGDTGAEALAQAKQYGPAQMAQMLTASPDVHKVGEEVVEGVRTTHYAGTVDSNAGLGALSDKDRQELEKGLEKLGAGKMTIDIWVDEQGLPRKQIVKADMSLGTVDVTSHFSDYGRPVQVSAPPADQVGDFSSFLDDLGAPRFPGS